MNSSRITPELGAPNVPQSAPSTTLDGNPAPGSSKPDTLPTAPSSNSEIDQLANKLAQQLHECLAHSTGWLIRAGQILGHYQRQTTHGQMTTIHNSGRLPWGQRYCQVLALLARNPTLGDPKMLQNLPSSVAGLQIIASYLNGDLIQEGVRRGLLHPRLTRRTALDVCRKLRTESLLKNPTVSLP